MSSRSEKIKSLLLPSDQSPELYFSEAVSAGRYRRLFVYNQLVDSPLQKLWVRTPPFRVAFNTLLSPNDWRSFRMRLAVSKIDPPESIWLDRVREIESQILDHLHAEIDPDLTLRSSLSDDRDPLWSVELPLVKTESGKELGFYIYNHDNRRVSVSRLENGERVAVYLELREVWIGEEEAGCNWSVMQMKIYPKLDFVGCLFDDEESEEFNPGTETECYHCLYCPNHHATTSVPRPAQPIAPPRPMIPIGLPPVGGSRPMMPRPAFNPADLLTQRAKLKSGRSEPAKSESKPTTPASFMPSLGDILAAKNRLKSIDSEQAEPEIDELLSRITARERQQTRDLEEIDRLYEALLNNKSG